MYGGWAVKEIYDIFGMVSLFVNLVIHSIWTIFKKYCTNSELCYYPIIICVLCTFILVISSFMFLQQCFLGPLLRPITRYNFAACDMLMTSLGHKWYRVSQTYKLLVVVMYNTKNVVDF